MKIQETEAPVDEASENEIVLSKPVTFGKKTISSLVIREPNAGDLRTLPNDPCNAQLLDLLARLTGQEVNLINKLCVKDAKAAIKKLGKLLDVGQEDGDDE